MNDPKRCGPVSARADPGYTVWGMRAPDRVGLRVLRALVLTGSSLALGGLAHAQAAPVRPGPAIALAAFAVLGLSWVATARQVRWSVIALVLGLGQALTHAALAAEHVQAPHAHGTGAVMLPAGAPVDGRMVLLHVGAWAALTLIFTVGERALWRSVQWLLCPWSPPRLPLPRPRALPATPLTPASTLAHRRVRGRAPPGP